MWISRGPSTTLSPHVAPLWRYSFQSEYDTQRYSSEDWRRRSAIQSKAPGSGVGKNPSQPLCNLRPCASRRTSHTPRSRTPIAPPIISAGQSVTANIDQNPPARHNHRRATPEEKHTKIALCGFSAGLTMKCEPSHHVVWHNMHRKTAIFQRPETTPPMPAYHTSPKTTEKRIVWGRSCRRPCTL